MRRKLLVYLAFLLSLPAVVHAQSPQGSRQIRRATLPDGTYELVRVDTGGIPFTLFSAPAYAVRLLGGSLELGETGAFRLELRMARVDLAGVIVRSSTKVDSGLVQVAVMGQGRAPRFLLANSRGTLTLWAARDSLIIRDSDRAMLFVRQR